MPIPYHVEKAQVIPTDSRCSVSAPTEAAARASTRQRLNDATLRGKTGVLVLVAAVGGVIAGLVEAELGNQLWPLSLMLTALLAAVIPWGHQWVAAPIECMTARLSKLADRGTSIELRELPVERGDEVGRMARAVQRIAAEARRHDHEARRLRRTINDRVEQATRRATRRLHEMAMRDPLTHLGNRRFLDEQLPPLVEAARETGTEVVCVMIDLDGFKQVNDELGHSAGDELLVLLGELIRGSTRDSDLTVRLGGDEFAVFMPGADGRRGQQFAEQLRKLFRQQTRAQRATGPRADLSVGIAMLLMDRCPDGDHLMGLADRNLYQAKRNGKGQTVGGGLPFAA